MSRFVWMVLSVSLMLMLGACQNARHPDAQAVSEPSKVYYTQFALFQEKNRFRTTNYRRGVLVPINTAFTVTQMDADSAELRFLDNPQKLVIENVKKHTGEDMYTHFTKIASLAKLDLKQFTSEEQANIQAGKAAIGMSRKAVLAAIGYPPITETPTLKSDAWVYWGARFDRFVVHFKNDKVERIVD